MADIGAQTGAQVTPRAPAQIFVFSQRGVGFLAKYRGNSEALARTRFVADYPEYEEDMAAGKVQVEARAPHY